MPELRPCLILGLIGSWLIQGAVFCSVVAGLKSNWSDAKRALANRPQF
jgi:hypothetical protein